MADTIGSISTCVWCFFVALQFSAKTLTVGGVYLSVSFQSIKKTAEWPEMDERTVSTQHVVTFVMGRWRSD